MINKPKQNNSLNLIEKENQFSPSIMNFKIENHLRSGQKEAFLNQAEQTAIQQERMRLEEETRKKQLIEERDRKIKENLKKVNQSKKQRELLNELKKQEEKQTQKEKLEKFNKELRSKIISGCNKSQKDMSQTNNKNNNDNNNDDNETEDFETNFNNINNNNNNNNNHKNHKNNKNNISNNDNNNNNSKNFYIIEDLGAKDKNSQKQQHHKQLSYYIHSERSKNNAAPSNKSILSAVKGNKRSNLVSKDFETFSFNENEIENEMEKPPMPTEKGSLRLINRELKENESVIDIREDIDLLIKRKLDLAKNSCLLAGESGTANNTDVNLDTEENNFYNYNSHQRLNSNNLKNNNFKNVNSTYADNNNSICDISSISNRKNLNSNNNLKNNLIRNIMAKPDNQAGSRSKLNSNNFSNYNFGINQNNQNSFYNFSTNILSSNRINDSALSDFSNETSNNKLRKTKSSNALSKNDFKNNNNNNKNNEANSKISGKQNVNNKSKGKTILNNYNSSKEEKKFDFNFSTENRISSANVKNSNAISSANNNSNSFYKITSTKRSVNNLKNSLNLNSKYFSMNTQNTEKDDNYADNADNYTSYATNPNKNHAIENNNNLNNTNNVNHNTSCLSDVNNIKFILDRNIDTVKNFRKTGLTRLPPPAEQNNNILGNINEVSYSNAHKNLNLNNTSLTSNSNNKNNQLSVRKFDILNVNNANNTNSNMNSKMINESIISKKRESKSQSKINVNLQKRRITKALKNLMVEKFKEKNIIIPNICSCGQLQRKIDTLLENKNINVYSLMNIECANNCIYYNNNTDYQKALTDIIKSVKNFKLENL